MHDQLHTCIHRDGGVKDPNFSRVIFALRNGSKARLSRSGRHVYFNTNVRDRIIYCWLPVSHKLCTFDVSREYSYQQDILKAKLWVMWYFWPGHTEFFFANVLLQPQKTLSCYHYSWLLFKVICYLLLPFPVAYWYFPLARAHFWCDLYKTIYWKQHKQ